MPTLRIEIKSRATADAEFAAAFKAARAGKKPSRPLRGIYFTSLESVRRLLSDKRMALLRLVRERHPRSIYELAKISGRNFKNVHADVALLKKYGLLRLPPRKRLFDKGPSRRPISVPYASINIHAFV